MKTIRILILATVVLGMFAAPSAASAQPAIWFPDKDDKIVFGGEFTLSAGEILNGDLVSFGGQITLEAESILKGDFVSLGGIVEAAGTITGDFVALGGNVEMSSTAVIEGDLALLGSSIHRETGSRVMGDVVTETGPFDFEFSALPELRFLPDFDGENFNFRFDQDWFGGLRAFSPFGYRSSVSNDMVWSLFRAFGLAALAVLVVIFLPDHTRRVTNAVLAEPVASGGIALVTMFAFPVLAILMSITIILIPVAILLALLFATALVFGWIAIGLEVGERLVTAMNQEWSPPIQAATGTFVLSFVVSLIGLIPCLGWLAFFIMLLLAFGGVLLTRFGTQPYPNSVVVEEPVKALPKTASTAKKKTTKKKTTKKS